jgi:hypothetical protein
MTELHFGSKPPVFKLEKIEELSAERSVFQFYVAFSGDAKVTIHTRVQINKVTPTQNYMSFSSLGRSSMSTKPLEMPLDLTVSGILLEGQFRVTVKHLERFLLQDPDHEITTITPHSTTTTSTTLNTSSSPTTMTTTASNRTLHISLQPYPIIMIQLLNHPLKNLTVTTNFDLHMPQVRNTFQDLVDSAAHNALKELQANPIEIDTRRFIEKNDHQQQTTMTTTTVTEVQQTTTTVS